MIRADEYLPPRPGRELLTRLRVIDALEAATVRGWTFVSAPAGFGKTVAVAQWLGRWRNRFAWATLDEYDDNEGRFARKFLGALSFAQKANRKLALAAERTRAPFLEYLLDTLSLLLDNDKRYALVLDDVHCLTSQSVLKALPMIQRRLPPGFSVILMGRGGVPDALVDLALKGDMPVIGPDVLAMDEAEVRALLSRTGAEPSLAHGLLERTGGWPIAVGALLMGDAARSEDLRGRELLCAGWTSTSGPAGATNGGSS